MQVLVMHFLTNKIYAFRTDKSCPALRSFLQDKGIVFCTVDKTQDFYKLDYEGIKIPAENWIDLQSLVKIKGGRNKDGMADLASRIIDKSYGEMKKEFPSERHDYWEEEPLSDLNLEYAAKDAYVSYQLYVQIWFFLRYLVFCPGCKKADKLRGALCRKCRVQEMDAEYAQRQAADELASLKAELASVKAELASLKAAASSENARANSPTSKCLSPASPEKNWDDLISSSSASPDGKRLKWGDMQ